MAALVPCAVPGADEAAISFEATGLDQPNALVVAELSGGADPEVAVSDRAGRLIVFDSTNGLVVSRLQRPDGLPLTAPIVGEFLGDGALHVAVGNVDGVVALYRGSNLGLLGEAAFPGSSFVGDPSAFAFHVPPGEASRDTLVLADSRGRIHALRADAGGTPRLLWEPVAPAGPLATPVTMGSISAPGQPRLVAATITGQLVLVDPATGEARVAILRDRQRPVGALVIDDIAGDGRDEVIVALGSGEVVARRWEDEAGADMAGALRDVWSVRLPWPANADPVLVRHPDARGRALLFVPHEGGLTVLDASDGALAGSASTRFAPEVSSQLAVLAHPEGPPSLLFATGRTLLRLETAAFFTGEAAPDPRAWRLGQRLGGPIGLARVRQPGGAQRTHAIAASSSGRLLIAALPEDQEGSGLPLWSTRGGTPRRDPVLDGAYAAREARRAARWEAILASRRAEYRAAVDSRDFEAAYGANRWLLREDPRDTRLVREGWQIWWRLNAAAAAILAFCLPAGFVAALLLARWVVRWRRLAGDARLALAEGRLEDAERHHAALLALRPHDNAVAIALARLRAQRGDDSLAALALYDRALAAGGGGQPVLLQARARALLQDGRFGTKEHAFYESVRDSFADPAPIDYALGRCLERQGRLDEAARRLRAALRGGHAPEGIYALLCDIYLRTDNRSAKAAAAYRREHPRRRHDLHFLECHLAASVEARHDDQRIESLCREILALQPGHPDARLRLAALRLRENRTAEAVEEAGRALAGAPGHPEAAMLLAHCHLIQGHEDIEAQQAYLAALETRPDDPEILRALAGIYQREGRHDPGAVAVLRRAVEHCPGDLPVLRALATVGRRESDPGLEATSLLSIRDLGALEPQEAVRLAHALVALGRRDEVAEAALREALRLAPDTRPLREALAPMLVQAGHRDAEALALLERLVQEDPARRDEALFLANAWIAEGRHADAAAVARELAAHHPHDEDVARLLALANYHDNRLDEAIADCLALLERRPGDPEVLVHLALATARKGRRDPHALALLGRALDEQPDNVEVLLAVAALRLVEARDEEAIALCGRAVALRSIASMDAQALVASTIARRPGAAGLRWFLVRLLTDAGKHDEALEQLLALRDAGDADPRQLLDALDPVLEGDPALADGLALRGQLLAGLGRLGAARDALEEAFRLRPSSPEVLRALVHVLRLQLDQAPDPFILFRLGKLHWLNLDHEQAISCFQKTAADYRLEAESTKMLGRCFMAKGMLDLALGEFRKLVMDEEAKELLYDLATRYEKKMDLVGAKTVYRQLFAADIDYKDVRARFESLAAHTSDPLTFDKVLVSQQLSTAAQRRYELLEEIGRGAMGVVYRAHDRELDEVVALKFLPEALSKNPEAVTRFREEVRLARRLSHPNIVRLHDIGEELGRRYISMELVDGPDLRARLRQLDGAPLPLAEVLACGAQLASALANAHRAGIIHRDIKPANVLLSPDLATAKLADFGLASARQATEVPGAGGTPLYMAPELHLGRAATTRSDIYSLGVLLYEIAAGHAPFTAGDLMEQHLHTAPPRPAGVPDALWQVIERALSKDPAQRQPSASHIADALEEIRERATA